MSSTVPYQSVELGEEASISRSQYFYEYMQKRRSVRNFSSKAIDSAVIKNIIQAASTVPSGANKQPWHFCVVQHTATKHAIRIAAEQEEYESYHKRMSEAWLADLKPLGTNWKKPFLEIVPCLIVVFKCIYDLQDNKQAPNYYVNESVGITCGMLLAAIHYAGLVALTHTPSPMNFLSKILERPSNERPFSLIPVGYPAKNVQVPNIRRKSFDKIACFY